MFCSGPALLSIDIDTELSIYLSIFCLNILLNPVSFRPWLAAVFSRRVLLHTPLLPNIPQRAPHPQFTPGAPPTSTPTHIS